MLILFKPIDRLQYYVYISEYCINECLQINWITQTKRSLGWVPYLHTLSLCVFIVSVWSFFIPAKHKTNRKRQKTHNAAEGETNNNHKHNEHFLSLSFFTQNFCSNNLNYLTFIQNFKTNFSQNFCRSTFLITSLWIYFQVSKCIQFYFFRHSKWTMESVCIRLNTI